MSHRPLRTAWAQLRRHPEFRRGAAEMSGISLGVAAWGLVTGVAMIKSGLSLRRHAFGEAAREAVFDCGGRAFQRAARTQRHPRHAGEGGAVIIRRPFEQPPQGCGQGRDGKQAPQRA